MIISENPQIKETALLSLALYVSLDKSLCFEYFPLFLQVLEENHQQLSSQIISLRSSFDFLLLFEFPQEMQEKALFLFKTQLFSKKIELSNIAIEGLCKLLFSKRLIKTLEINILANLLLLWWDFGENTDKNQREIFRIQFISLFLRNFTWNSAKNLNSFEKSFEIIVKCFIIFYKEKVHFQRNFALFEINNINFFNNFLRIGIYLLKTQENKAFYQKSLSPQEKFFFFLCRTHVTNQMDSQLNAIFDKCLTQFDFNDINPLKSGVLAEFLNKLSKNYPDFKRKRNLLNFREKFTENTRNFNGEKGEIVEILKNNAKRQAFMEVQINRLFSEWKEFKVILFSRINLAKYHINIAF